MNEKKGIAVAGTILVDKLYEISAYPHAGELTKIRSISRSAGGLVPNDAIDLKRLAPDLPVYAVGKVGDDAEGRFATELMAREGVDVSRVRVSAGETTSFTDVMSVTGGQRTFFTYAGANATFGYDEVFGGEELPCKMLHLGYFLLLDAVDGGEGERILKEAKRRGITTSIDLVSENSDRYACVLPCLPYVDNLIVNELEAGKLAGMEPTEENLPAIAKELMRLGVRERVIIHTPAMALCQSESGCLTMPSCRLPEGYIRGTTGAGDAFCSGALLAIHEGKSDEELLRYARMAAAASLRTVDATSGLCPLSEIAELLSGLESN